MDSFTYPFHLWVTIILIAVIMGGVQGACAYLVFLERKVAAYVQDRIGPNRVGPWGLFQPIADGLKFLLKEQVIPLEVDKLFYLVAPAVAVSTALIALAVVPFGPTVPPVNTPWPQTTAEAAAVAPELKEQIAEYDAHTQAVIAPHVDIGILFVLAVGSLAVYGVILGGWSSNNKYSFLGALRSSAQLVSYEIPMGLSALAAVLLSNSLNLEEIIGHQAQTGWHFWYQPLAGLLFYTSVLAENNRLPFDLPEAEQELVGGYHTEYSAMKFALFFLGEYTHMVTTSLLVVVLFFGGWHFPWIGRPESPWVLKAAVIVGKMLVVILVTMLIRWTIPRFRFDQLMGLAWKVLIPLALGNLLCVMVVKQLAEARGWSPWVQLVALLAASLVILAAAGYVTLLMPRSRRPVNPAAPQRVPPEAALR